MRPKALWRGVMLALVAAFVGCTLVVHPDAAQCSSDRDCLRFGWMTCVQGGCIPREASAPPPPDPNAPCSTTQDCSPIHPEGFWVCQSGQCNSLKSGDCGTVLGGYSADDVLILGAMLPLYGDAHKSTGIPMSRALNLAAAEDFAAGIPFGDGTTRHPVAIVLCDEVQDPVRAARHLVEDLHVPAILGPASASSLLPVATQVTIPHGVLLVSPYATSYLFAPDAGGLVWRTAPDARYEGAAMAALVPQVFEPKIRALNEDTPIRVALLWKNDPDNVTLAGFVKPALTFNGVSADANGALYTSAFYDDPESASPSDVATLVDSVVQARPDLIVVAGNAEAVDVITKIEANWITSNRRPFYLLSHGLEVAELLALAGVRQTLSSRVILTAPGAPSTDPVWFTLKVRYALKDYPAQTFGVAQTYDAFYLLAYALAAVRNTDVIGHDLRDGLSTILGFADGGKPAPLAVNVGPSQIDATIAAIRAGTPIRLHGAAGEYDFDPSNGSSPSNVQTACIVDDDGLTFDGSDRVFIAATGTLDTVESGASCFQ